MSDTRDSTEISRPPRLFVGEWDRVADPQGRIQIPDTWLYDDPQDFLVRCQSFAPGVITVYPPDFLTKTVPELSTLDPGVLVELAKIGTQFRQVTVDRNGRLPLTDAKFKEILIPEGKSAPVKLFGNVHCFSLCPAHAWSHVKNFMDSHVGSALQQQPATAAPAG